MFCSILRPIQTLPCKSARRLGNSRLEFGLATTSRISVGKRPCARRFSGQRGCQRIVAVQNSGASPEYPRAPQGGPPINSPLMVEIPTSVPEILSLVRQKFVSFLRFLISVGELVPKIVFPESTLFSKKMMFQLSRDSIVVLVAMALWMLMLYPLDVAAFRFRWAIQALKTVVLKT
ncbi:hypothetical protein CYMTET_23330 [Cymbomonas tetramitiformis]|uniref:Uncharacterized protein n=1 Tax=Cymbomonas tetramitiformis TaxID=36881 RepID=A0AAE0FY47_9CHLO|nr:hypothetical protein CYMTET_23330 [Cymbomonas tetramitiformis]